jgi:hypothetical protein
MVELVNTDLVDEALYPDARLNGNGLHSGKQD